MDTIKYNIFSGCVSGLCEVLVTHPLDVVKTKSQFHNMTRHVFIPLYFFRKNVEFYKGIKPRLLGVIPMRTIFWTTIESTNYILKDSHLSDCKRLVTAGILGGLAQSVVDIPIENVKVQNITRNNYNLNNISYFRAGWLTASRNVGFAVTLNLCLHYNNDHTSTSWDFYRAGVGAVLGSVITQPLDYFKTQIQSNNYPSVPHIIHNAKPSAMFTGTITRSAMGFINMGIGYTVFSSVKSLIT